MACFKGLPLSAIVPNYSGISKYMILSSKTFSRFDPVSALSHPLSACADGCIVRRPASRLKTKWGSVCIAAGGRKH